MKVSQRYGRLQFLKDAEWLGLPPEFAYSRTELRRRRNRLMIAHHPDRGGSAETAARINETYARMAEWLDHRNARCVKAKNATASSPDAPAKEKRIFRSALSAALHGGAAQIFAWALVAAATYAVRGRRR